MQEVDKDASNHELIGTDKEITRAYTTGMAEHLGFWFKQTREDILSGRLEDEDRRRLFYYSDHDSAIFAYAAAFNFDLDQYPPFAYRMLFELYLYQDKFYVVLLMNDEMAQLPRGCGREKVCELDTFL